jgi:large subunit ribosomal protein L21
MPDIAFRVPKLEADVGSKVSLDKVLLVSDGKKIAVGQPYLEGKAIEGEVLRHGRDKKIIVFKKKRRKKYRVTRGHRQQFTEIVVKSL